MKLLTLIAVLFVFVSVAAAMGGTSGSSSARCQRGLDVQHRPAGHCGHGSGRVVVSDRR